MGKYIRYAAYLLLAHAGMAAAGDGREEGEPKVISGMSIVGNDETAKSLYIVPWKSSEVGKVAGLSSSVLNEELKPVDKKSFIRELDFYRSNDPN